MAQQQREILDFVVVARTAPGPYPHPVEVAVHFDGADSVLSFSIGPHAANAGGQVWLSRVLDGPQTGLNPRFATEFDAAELDWLVPLLVRLRAGEEVAQEVEDAYRARHGKWPKTMQEGRYTS
ncbi:hypothetical protein [Glycomyces paridis]|uniref:Uncharacterized protein n=1 Tax=Glycomyces paridis TaxID=2126555 RepID=A0A4S8PKT6_9ACTN|nr:hypothetical protein [Glycomyces paridis]THV30691.1 hypothetical protein E9998_04710 [Glycomyces paridis]